MKRILDFLWPAEKYTANDIAQDQKDLATDLAIIGSAQWSNADELVLSEAHRLYDEEEERRRVADSKATNYLVVAVALMSLLTFFEGVVWGEKIGAAPRWLAFSLLTLALVYAAGFGYWAFEAIKLANYSRIGPTELATMAFSNGANHVPFIDRYLRCARQNQIVNNMRLTYLKSAHRFLFRVFLLLAAVVVLESGYGIFVGDSKTEPKEKAIACGASDSDSKQQHDATFDRRCLQFL